MQITSVKSEENAIGFGSAYVLRGEDVDFLVGRILTLVESLGLKDTQEKAVKDLVRQEIWHPFNLPFTTYIDSDLHTVIKIALENSHKYFQKKAATSQNIPANNKLKYELVISE